MELKHFNVEVWTTKKGTIDNIKYIAKNLCDVANDLNKHFPDCSYNIIRVKQI